MGALSNPSADDVRIRPVTDLILEGLPAVVGDRPRVLVLGSMPGEQSLRCQQYYAHPRNDFWRVMEDVLGIPRQRTYAERVELLKGKGIALWDVLAACVRPGSLDARIDRASMRTNDILGLALRHGSLERIVFNGAFAQTVFLSRIAPGAVLPAHIGLMRLPSTSPANASRRYDEKLAAWRSALEP